MVTPMLKAEHDYPLPVLKLLATALSVAVLSGCATGGNGLDELIDEAPLTDIEFSTDDEVEYRGATTFDRRVYATAGAGVSRLEPNTDEAGGVTVADEIDAGAQLTAGIDLSNTFSLELHTTELGSAQLDPTGSVSYATHGGSVLMYAGRQRGERRGFMGFGRAGVAAASVEGIGDVTIVSDEDPQPLIGAGMEYMARNLGVRGEIIVFDKDAQFAQLGVVYRLNSPGGSADELPDTISPSPLPLPAPAPAPTPTPTPAPAPQNAGDLPEAVLPLEELPTPTELPTELPAVPDSPVIADGDADGIPDAQDLCPATDPGIAVDSDGCLLFNGVVDGVNFEQGSSLLTPQAQSILDSVISTLRQHPDSLVAIAAHTDNLGDERYNLTLSRERAISVARYLITRGVPKSLMSARAYGEYQPIAGNDTENGRARNRRVEIVASKPARN